MSQVPGTSRDQAADASEPYVVVSIDSHLGPSAKGQLREYCDSRHLADFDRFAVEMEGDHRRHLRLANRTRQVHLNPAPPL